MLYSEFQKGGGELKFTSPVAGQLTRALQAALDSRRSLASRSIHKLSKSDGDLRTAKCSDADMGDVRRSSWYSGPSEVSLDDIDLVMSKESKHIPTGQLSRCTGAGQLTGQLTAFTPPFNVQSVTSFDDSVSDRRSLVSVASGIYEEIPDLPEGACPAPAGLDVPDGLLKVLEEPTYESVAECVYATMRRRRPPPPLPPRHPFGASTLKPGTSWTRCGSACDSNVTRHSSLGSLPRCSTQTLPKLDKRQPFSVFRKRLKSDSRVTASQKSETSKENKDVETKKKKFDFTPTRDIFKSFKVSRKMKNLKITTGTLAKGETKSCEFLDDTEPVPTNRCSKSVECLEDEYNFEADLSIEFTEESIAALSLPQQIVELLLGHEQLNKVRLKEEAESEYMPMSPIVPPPIEHHYIVMSPRPHLA
ncbi:unnamed protein product [Arctia plantaginis]|uniref:Uncharacterized protein n=1 Tax=Arctia plantaginis TaxID=874455 RepID=A0A8S1AMM7_ARCPL|nr:unnamed protein product [Arctia plantaginis]CAB3257926.1 unnamed protein product [Arctia plantaginis]